MRDLIFRQRLIGFVCLCTLLLGCTQTAVPAAQIPPSPQPTSEPTSTPSPTPLPPDRFVQVDGVDIETSRGYLQFVVHITLPNSCHEIGPIEQTHRGRNITITIGRLVRQESNCTDQSRQVTQIIDIDTAGFETGFYAFNVNNFADSFPLDDDLADEINSYIALENAAQATLVYQATATAAATATQGAREALGMAEVHGVVWHDLCLSSFGEAAAEIEPADGCLRNPTGDITANGIREENEPGIPFITLSIGQGSCPSQTALATALTTADGAFSFFDLPPDTYCLYTTNENENGALLTDGVWTTAVPSTTYSQTITLHPLEKMSDINLGWDYTSLPRADIATGCANKGYLLFHLNYADTTTFRLGETVTKGWRIQNIGTCSWEPDYGLVRLNSAGEFDPEEIILLDQVILPNEAGDITITADLPRKGGRYQWRWVMVDSEQTPFPLGLAGDELLPFDFVIPSPATPTPTATATLES